MAALLGVSRYTVYRLATGGELAHVRVGNVIRIPAGALAQFLETGGRVPEG